MPRRSGFRNRRRRWTSFGAKPPHPELFELLAQAAANVQRTAELLHDELAGWPDGPAFRAEITACEHEGDRLTHKVLATLHRIKMSPVDRHDIHALAEAIDDVVDELEEVSEEIATYRIEAPMEPAQKLAGVARDSGRALRRALVGFLAGDPLDGVMDEIRTLEHEGDRLYREALAGLFAVSVDPMLVIRWKDIYQGLEDSIDRCRQAANVLQRIAVKYG